MRIFTLYVLVSCLTTASFSAEKPRPKFSDYPVRQIYKGKPADPALSKDQRSFRTVIREGAKSDVEYAGHYTVPRFGCGASCNGFYIVDSISGRVYDGFGVTDLLPSEINGVSDMPRMEFHPNSRLLKINGCPNETDCGFYDYVVVDGVGLKQVYKKLLSTATPPLTPTRIRPEIAEGLLCGASEPERIRPARNSRESFCGVSVRPLYPPLAKRARIQGPVTLRAVIGKDGLIKSLQLVEGHPMLVAAAMDAVRHWKYKPYYEGEKPLEIETTIVVHFTLEGEDPALNGTADLNGHHNRTRQ